MDKSKYFLDLSKCTEEEQKHVISLLPESEYEGGYEVHTRYKYLHYNEFYWFVGNGVAIYNRTELTYPEFIKLFVGGDGENKGWIKIESEADLPKESGDYFVFTKDRNTETIYVDGDISVMEHTSQSWIRNFTHYQPIVKPEPPNSNQ